MGNNGDVFGLMQSFYLYEYILGMTLEFESSFSATSITFDMCFYIDHPLLVQLVGLVLFKRVISLCPLT